MSNYNDEYQCRRSGILILGYNGMIGKGREGLLLWYLPPPRSSFQRVTSERPWVKQGKEGEKGVGEEERRLLKVGGKFGSAAKLTQLSSPLLKRNFGSPTPALPACLCLLTFRLLFFLHFIPCFLISILSSFYIHSSSVARISNVFWNYYFSVNFRHDVSPWRSIGIDPTGVTLVYLSFTCYFPYIDHINLWPNQIRNEAFCNQNEKF